MSDSRKKPLDFDPELGIRLGIFGRSGCGKSHVMLRLLIGPLRGKFDDLALICPSLGFDKKLAIVKWDPEKMWNEYSEALLADIRDGCDGSRQTLIILDDCISDMRNKNSTSTPLNNVAISGRHQGISLLVTSQKVSALSTTLRAQFSHIIFFPTADAGELRALSRMCGFIGSERDFREFVKEHAHSEREFIMADLRGMKMYNFKFELIWP